MNKEMNSRRGFLKFTGMLAGTVVAAPTLMAKANNTAEKSVYSDYDKVRIGSLNQIKKDGEFDFSYPDDSSLCKAVYVENQVKAYSTICTHKGCPTMYDKATSTFICPCHFSKFDALKDGQMIIGHATGGLPRVLLEIEGDDVFAIGMDGLIFGRINNTKG